MFMAINDAEQHIMVMKSFTALSRLISKLEKLIESPRGIQGVPIRQVTSKDLVALISDKYLSGQLN
jgi:hypothetical protein